MEPIGIATGIGACFGYNVISYDGNIVYVSADPDKNYRYNLTNERMVLTNARSACITPDGIMTTETGVINIPLVLGSFSGYKEVLLIANHIYDKSEGGSDTTYRLYVNPDSEGKWGDILKNESSTMEDWLKLVETSLRRNQEVILGYFKITRVGTDHKILEVKNPYHYTWGIAKYVTLDRHITDINNLKSMIPIFEAIKIALNNKSIHISLRSFINDPDVTEDESSILTLLEPGLLLNKLGDALDLSFGGTLDCSSKGIDLAKQIIIDVTAEMDYVIPVAVEIKWQSPIAFNWLSASTENPINGKRLSQNTHSVYGTVSMSKNNFHLLMNLYPIKANQGVVAANLLPKMDFTQRLAFMAQLSEMFEVILDVQSQPGTTGSGDVSGSGKYRRGTTVIVNASPSLGSGFVGWYEGNTLISAEASYQFEIERTINYIAMFNGSSTKVEIKVSVVPPGKATIKGPGMYTINTQCTLQCTPNSGYGFKQWEIDGQVYTINPYTFGVSKGLTANCILVAPKREIKLFSNPSGIFSLVGAGSFEVGKNVTVNATLVNSAYLFKGWYFDSVSSVNLASTNPNYSFVMPDKNLNLMAYGELKPVQRYQVTVNVSGNGYVTGEGWYDEGSTCSLTAYTQDGSTFNGWSGDQSGSSQTITFTVNNNKYITASFSGGGVGPGPTQFYLSTHVNGSGTVTEGGWYDEGTYATVIMQQLMGSTFTGWSGDASGMDNPLSVYMDRDKIVTANFVGGGGETDTYRLSTATNGPGDVFGAGDYSEGTYATVRATPSGNASFTGWSGDLTGSSNPAQVLMDRNKSVTANFSGGMPQDQVTLSVTVVGRDWGYTNVEGSQKYNVGSSITLNAAPYAYGKFMGWTGDITSSNKTLNFTITKDMNLTATFIKSEIPPAEDQLDTNVFPPNGGRIDVTDGPTGYWTVQAVPAPGWSFTNWGNAIGGSINPTTIKKEGIKKTLVANFVENPSGDTAEVHISGLPKDISRQCRYNIVGYMESLDTAWATVGKNQRINIRVTEIPDGYYIKEWRDQDNNRVESGSADWYYTVTKNTSLIATFTNGTD